MLSLLDDAMDLLPDGNQFLAGNGKNGACAWHVMGNGRHRVDPLLKHRLDELVFT